VAPTANPAPVRRADARRTGATRKPRRNAMRRREALTGYLFITPQLAGAIGLVIIPLVVVFYYSLHDWNALSSSFTFVGAGNYTKLLADPSFADSLVASAWFSIGLVTLNIVLALALAVLLNQRLPGTTLFRTFFFSPVIVSLVAWSIVWSFLLQFDGGINGFLSAVGIQGPNWLRTGPTAMLSVIVVQVFKNVGLNMILFLAALQSVPLELREAARIDGARAWRVFRSITLPLISPTLLLVSIITVIGSLEVFAQIAVLTGGGPGNSTTVLVFFLYQKAFRYHQFGYASAVGVVLFVIVLLLTLAQFQTRRRWVHDEV
jgi:multiple sugar transport system permease protein